MQQGSIYRHQAVTPSRPYSGAGGWGASPSSPNRALPDRSTSRRGHPGRRAAAANSAAPRHEMRLCASPRTARAPGPPLPTPSPVRPAVWRIHILWIRIQTVQR